MGKDELADVLSAEKVGLKIRRGEVAPRGLHVELLIEHYRRPGRVVDDEAGLFEVLRQIVSNKGACKEKDSVHLFLCAAN